MSYVIKNSLKQINVKKIFSILVSCVLMLLTSIHFSFDSFADDEDSGQVGVAILTFVAEAPQVINQAVNAVNQMAPAIDHFVHNERVERVVGAAINGATAGAATGAIGGAVVGGAGAVPGAIGGAVLGAVGGVINGLLQN